ncbi:wiskott-Aldrich syndrome protein homolog 1-like isoform X6 [Panicum virgatum]|uniref:Uncharacterized protein n=1 Tax=Panicum virgatum TaxID=38727 RepID=A0A8T0XU44_PANVG|nr:wiskott-Aldrich syndrome protein homolog 1-like isoform X6 [Panicum virgatum]XP_039855623.1 wiskott-Aldrich syndrome protein homolog 1-like isoform X6 [Panicum virgatum]KAG2660653.1 hypothetical protein PVAP13_1KG457900 [Panicum virgatum]
MESPPSAPASDGFPSPPSAPSPAITLSSIPIHFFGHQRSRTPPLSLAGRAHSPPPLPPLASDDGAACVARRGRGSRPAQPGRGARSPAVSARQPRLLAGGEWAPDGLPPRSRTSAAHPRALLPSSPAEGEAPPPVPTPRTSTASFPFSSAQTEGEGREHAQELGGLLRLGTFCRNSSPTAKSAPPAVHSGGKVELKRRGSLHWTNRWKLVFLIWFLSSGHINSVQHIGWFNVKREIFSIMNMLILHHIVFLSILFTRTPGCSTFLSTEIFHCDRSLLNLMFLGAFWLMKWAWAKLSSF